MLNCSCDNVPFCLFANYIIGHYHFFCLLIPQSFYTIMAVMRFDATLILWYIYSYKEVVRDDRKTGDRIRAFFVR